MKNNLPQADDSKKKFTITIEVFENCQGFNLMNHTQTPVSVQEIIGVLHYQASVLTIEQNHKNVTEWLKKRKKMYNS